MGHIAVDDRATGASRETVSRSVSFFHSIDVETPITVLVTPKESLGFKKSEILDIKRGFNYMNVSSSNHV